MLYCGCRSTRRDHPRRCGKNLPTIIIEIVKSGSPPQVRGKLRLRCDIGSACRITPAGAGKTVKISDQRQSREDHPRRCGENARQIAYIHGGAGSPPQVRGKLRFSRTAATLTRITPAGAGKTACHLRFSKCNQDHPRRCGENVFIAFVQGYYEGSPPQVRGKLYKAAEILGVERITPAGAGKTTSLPCWMP